jgi:hypothetical protein
METARNQGGTRGAALPKVDKKARYFLLCGDAEPAIEAFKSAIIAAHLTPEEREANYREIAPPSGQGPLAKVLPEVEAELSTVSLLGGKRVVTLYGVQDFFESRPGKASARAKAPAKATPRRQSASEVLAEFARERLHPVDAVLIVVAIEDYEKWKKVSAGNPAVALAKELGTLHQFRETGPQFAFFDALFARRAGEALALWRQWIEAAAGSPKPYQQLAVQMRLLLQAKTLASPQVKSRGISRAKFAEEFLPKEPDRNLCALRPEWRQEKLARFASNFSFQEILAAYERLEPLQKYAVPLNSDPFVPDRRLLAEIWILELCGDGVPA